MGVVKGLIGASRSWRGTATLITFGLSKIGVQSGPRRRARGVRSGASAARLALARRLLMARPWGRCDSRARPSAPRRSWRAWTASSRPSGAPGPSCRPPARRSSPRHRRARRPWSHPAPSGVGATRRLAGLPGRRAVRRRYGGLGRGPLARLPQRRLAGWRLGRAGVERGKRLAQAVGFAGELVKALLNLFTQTVDHVGSMWLRSRGGRDRTRRSTARRGSVVGWKQVHRPEPARKAPVASERINALGVESPVSDLLCRGGSRRVHSLRNWYRNDGRPYVS